MADQYIIRFDYQCDRQNGPGPERIMAQNRLWQMVVLAVSRRQRIVRYRVNALLANKRGVRCAYISSGNSIVLRNRVSLYRTISIYHIAIDYGYYISVIYCAIACALIYSGILIIDHY